MLLHGFTGHARSWDAFAEAMTDRYRVLALDQRGHGETAWAAADKYGAEEMVDDLAAFVAAMGLQRFALLGLSMGGNVAIHYGGRRPPKLAELVIVDIAPEIVPQRAPRASRPACAAATCSPRATRRSRPRAPPIRRRPRRIIVIASSTA